MADEWHQAGSRLKLRFYEAADGAKQFAGWFDSTRNEECYFAKLDDGAYHCAPLALGAPAVYFADAGCAQPLAYRLKAGGGPAPKYAYATVNGGNRLYPVTGGFAGTPYVGSPGACIAAASATGSYDFYSTSTALAPSAFVAGDLKTSS